MSTLKTIETAAKIGTVFLIFVEVICASVQAQTLGADKGPNADTTLQFEPATRSRIRLAQNVNAEAKAIEIQHSINSPYEDIKPTLAPNGSRLYFSRIFHPGNANGVKDPEDIWYSDFDRASGAWSLPIHMRGILNNAGPNYINNVSVTGDTIILGNQYHKKGKMRAGLSYSVNQNGTWSLPKTIYIQNDYNVSRHSNSYVDISTGVIILSAQRDESMGERDLFVSFWDGEMATEPISMGGIINTAFEESSPFLAADKKTLYFASKGHNGYGGFDIYVTRRLDDTWTNWSAPENLGPAVNGPLDDEFFTISHCRNHAVFSKQVSVHDTNLFRISLRDLFKGQPLKQDSGPVKKSSLASL